MEIQWLNEQLQNQQENGLRHDDFQRYRKFADRKVLRLRKELHVSFGKDQKFIGKQLNQKSFIFNVDGKLSDQAKTFILLVLWESEKSFAFGLESKAGNNARHAQKRFRRSSEYALIALELCFAAFGYSEDFKAENFSLSVDQPETLLELFFHFCFVDGRKHFESRDWKRALIQFSTCRKVLAKLSSVQPFVVKSRVNQLVPFIRYCRYHLGDEMELDRDDSDIDTASPQTTITLRQQTVYVFNFKLVEILEQIKSSHDSEELLALFSEGVQVANSDLSSENTGSYVLHSYFSFERAKLCILRDWSIYLQLAHILKASFHTFPVSTSISAVKLPEASKKKASESQLVRFCDNILQSLDAISNLFLLKDDLGFQMDMEVYSHFVNSLRSLHLSRYERSSGKMVDVSSTLESSFQALRDAKLKMNLAQMVETVELKKAFDLPVSIDTLETKILEEKMQNSLVIQDSPTGIPPLVEAKLQLVPQKPIFFDLAYHNLVDGIFDEENAETTEKKGIIGGIMTSIFGR